MVCARLEALGIGSINPARKCAGLILPSRQKIEIARAISAQSACPSCIAAGVDAHFINIFGDQAFKKCHLRQKVQPVVARYPKRGATSQVRADQVRSSSIVVGKLSIIKYPL